MGTRSGPTYGQPWQGTLRAMKAAGTRLQLSSCECSRKPGAVDLGALSDHLGEDADLWDRTVRCDRCGKARRYMASVGEGTPFGPLVTNGREMRWPPDVESARARKAFMKAIGLTRRDVARLSRMVAWGHDERTKIAWRYRRRTLDNGGAIHPVAARVADAPSHIAAELIHDVGVDANGLAVPGAEGLRVDGGAPRCRSGSVAPQR